MRIEHLLPSGLLGRRPLRILVVGAGGTGSAIVMGLPYLHQAMRVWGHPYGLEVTLMDGDTVSETNCVRQPFSWSDVGQNKATVLINRINLFWGTKWNDQPACFDEATLRLNHDRNPDLLIGCVDTRAARGVIERSVTRKSSYVAYWLLYKRWLLCVCKRSCAGTSRLLCRRYEGYVYVDRCLRSCLKNVAFPWFLNCA